MLRICVIVCVCMQVCDCESMCVIVCVYVQVHLKKKIEYHEKVQYFLSLISESEIHIIEINYTEWNISSLYFLKIW